VTLLRTGLYDMAHHQSNRRVNDRMRHKPASLLRWLQENYALEAPVRLHARGLEEDGDPTMNGEARAYLGFSQGELGGDWLGATARANDWVRVAHRCDPDGRYITPMRAAIARVGDYNERAMLMALATNVLLSLDVTRSHDIPDWCRHDVVNASLERLWWSWRDAPLPSSRWRDGPLPSKRGISDSQAIAEAAS
jgi:hypothetical protein